MENQIITILVALLSSGLIQFFFNKWQDKHSKLNKIDQKLDYLEIGLIRTQLLVLMSNYNNRQEEIMKVAKKYFRDLCGDFYLTTLFKDWLEKNNLEKPTWFEESQYG